MPYILYIRCKSIRLLLMTVVCFIACNAGAQEMDDVLMPDSTPLLTRKDSAALLKFEKQTTKETQKKAKRDWATWKPDPKRAMWLAIVIPGAGQIYNRKDYSQAYLDIMDNDPNTKSYTQFLHLGTEITSANEDRYIQIFKSRKDKYRRWRDLSFFCMLGVYALSIVDAYVDASLSSFDISDDLSLQIEPTVMNNNRTSAIGVHGALNF